MFHRFFNNNQYSNVIFKKHIMQTLSERKDSLDNFPVPPKKCLFTTAVRNGHIINIKESDSQMNKETKIESTISTIDDKANGLDIFFPIQLYNYWVSNSLYELLERISNISSSNIFAQVLIKICAVMVIISKVCEMIKDFLYPLRINSCKVFFSEISDNRNWLSGWARSVAWHPVEAKLAIALANQSIAVYDFTCSRLMGKGDREVDGSSCNEDNIEPIVIRVDRVKNVVEMNWSYNSTNQLCICCESGLYIIDVSSMNSEDSPDNRTNVYAKQEEIGPISCSVWCPRINEVFCCSPSSMYMHVFNIGLMNTSQFIDKQGVCFISLSPDGKNVAISTRLNKLIIMNRQDNTMRSFNLKSCAKSLTWDPLSSGVFFIIDSCTGMFRATVSQESDVNQLIHYPMAELQIDNLADQGTSANGETMKSMVAKVSDYELNDENMEQLAEDTYTNPQQYYDEDMCVDDDNSNQHIKHTRGDNCMDTSVLPDVSDFSTVKDSNAQEEYILGGTDRGGTFTPGVGELATFGFVECREIHSTHNYETLQTGEITCNNSGGITTNGLQQEQQSKLQQTRETFGGIVQSMVIQQSRNLMAVVFKNNSKLVVLFDLNYNEDSQDYELIAKGTIRCRSIENIDIIRLKSHGKNICILTMVLDSGSVRFVPIYTCDPSDIDPLLISESIRCSPAFKEAKQLESPRPLSRCSKSSVNISQSYL